MSEATEELTRLVGKLSLLRRRFPALKLVDLAYGLFEEISDADELDRLLASAELNKREFLIEASPERLHLHQAIVAAAQKYKFHHPRKDGRHGSTRR